jgi:predicted aspartyl protease
MQPFPYQVTVSSPHGQYTVEALVDPGATFSSFPAPALIELGIEPVRVIRLKSTDGEVNFRRLGRALQTVAGAEDIAPVLFGDPSEPSLVGSVTLSILLLEADFENSKLSPKDALSSDRGARFR